MADYGKWVGGALGWALGGPIGALLGYQVGKMFQGFTSSDGEPSVFEKRTQRGDFSMALVVLSAAVMKADGKIMKSELKYVKSFLRVNFGPKEAEQLTLLLRSVLKENIDYRKVASQIRFHMDHPKRMLLLQYLYGISNADGEVHPQELDIIRFIAKYLGISDKDRLSIEQAYHSVSDPYKVLEITRDSTDTDVKKAYRKLAVKFHPDKIGNLGEGPRKKAKERFIQIQEAYEQIKKVRGFK
ncbi:MAG: molecular chaperone DjlA [Crocinitomicaceae bacterium]|nr:molecular chaperone DjlA [Crocinitomicaceae bacterium]|tara:strand:- start:1673 stop:2398 length:726 start_codon:yes stop_codon:yes gene_type:complete